MQNAHRSVCILHCALCMTAMLALSACGARRIALPSDPGAPLPDFADVPHADRLVWRRSHVYRGAGLSAVREESRSWTRDSGLRPARFTEARRRRTRSAHRFILARAARMRHCSCLATIEWYERRRPIKSWRRSRVSRCRPPTCRHADRMRCPERNAGSRKTCTRAGGRRLILTAARWSTWSARVRSGVCVRAGIASGEIELSVVAGAFPGAVRLISLRPGVDVDLTAAVSQLETNVQIDEAAFTVDVPPGASELSLAELRQAGPLRN